ncbi:hypothetical protein [Streptomyces sp. NPDC101178]|uniref:hypothetical protein n=1 Tax=Streptomyces sp. NPDC101178 TaxID=3366124 RepID=UPI003826224C
MAGQVRGGPVGRQGEEGGQAALDTAEQAAEFGGGQFDLRAAAPLGVGGEPEAVADALDR